jgi:hypothetical protein
MQNDAGSEPSHVDAAVTYEGSDTPCDLALVAGLDTGNCGHPLTAQRMVLKSCPTCPADCVGHQACLAHAHQVMGDGAVHYEKAP